MSEMPPTVPEGIDDLAVWIADLLKVSPWRLSTSQADRTVTLPIEVARRLAFRATGLPVRRFLDVSIAHLPKHLGTGGILEIEELYVDERPHGYWLWVPDNDDLITLRLESDIPRELAGIMFYARERDCDWVLFDADAEPIENMRIYDWSND